METQIYPFIKAREFNQQSPIYIFENQTQQKFDEFVEQNLLSETEGFRVLNYVFNHSDILEEADYQTNDWSLFKSILRASYFEKYMLLKIKNRDEIAMKLNTNFYLDKKLSIDVFYLHLKMSPEFFELSGIYHTLREYVIEFGIYLVISLEKEKSPSISKRNKNSSYSSTSLF